MTKNDLVRILGQDLDSKELQQLYIDELVREKLSNVVDEKS